jgi:hypothetical protein
MRFRKSLKSIRISTLVAVLISAFGAYALSSAPQMGVAANSVNRLYGAYWQVGEGNLSTVTLKNNDAGNAAALQLTLFGAAGQPVGTAQISIPAGSVRHVDLVGMVGEQGGSGGLRVDLVSGSARVEGRVTIVDLQSGADMDLPLLGGYRFDTENALHAPWWLPDAGTSGRITLFNSSGQAIVVSAAVAVEGAERTFDSVTLKPNESKELSLRNLLHRMDAETAVTGSVILKYSGPAHALQPSFLLLNRGTGFALAPSFNGKHDRETAAETSWLFPDVGVTDDARPEAGSETQVRTYALLSNGTKARLTPALVAYFSRDAGEKGQQAALPVDALRPLETRLVELGQLLENTKTAPANLSRISLGATHAGAPGDLGITVFSVQATKNLVSKSAGIVLPTDVADISYWQMAGEQPAAVENGRAASVQTGVTLYYQTPYGVESYSLNAINVKGNASEKLGLASSLHSGFADNAGNTLPSGTTFGVATLSLIAGNENGMRVVGSRPECLLDCASAPSSPLSQKAISAKSGDVSFGGVKPACAAPPPTPVPTYFGPTAESTASCDCEANTAGTCIQVTNQVLDQDGATLAESGITPQEKVCVNGTCQPTFNNFSTPATTTSTGTFNDIPIGTCFGPPVPTTNACVTVTVTYQALLSSSTYPITTTASRTDCVQGEKDTISGNPSAYNKTYQTGTIP